MPMNALLRELAAATAFEQAALACLRALRGVSGHPDVLRMLLHLRPDDGYAGLWVLDGAGLHPPDAGADVVPSASVWHRIAARGEAVAVDVSSGDGLTTGTQLRLSRREATHLYAVPLCAPGGRLIGAATLEARGPGAWNAGALAAVADASGPYLAALPPRAAEAAPADALLPVVGAAMAAALPMLRAFAAEDETILVRGETGVGKSRLARWIHARSARSAGPFEVLDLLTVPEDMQMGELVGWKRGAFTGADRDHAGFVARAQGGTLFLDEVDKLSLKAQAGLLHLLEDRRYRVLGDASGARQADVRFVVGTNADLLEAVREGRFREDLYYRINVLPFELRPLRSRRDEIGGWARFMLERRHAEKGRPGSVTLAADAVRLLEAQAWPGNLRELDNVMRRVHTLAALDGGATIEGRHVEAALGLGRGPSAAARPGERLTAAVEALAAHLNAARPPIALDDLDVAGALAGLLLVEAVRVAGSREAAFELVGRGELVRNRNHHRAFHRDQARAADLFRRLGETPPPSVAADDEGTR